MNRILLCIDGSSYSESCCGYAAWAGKRMGAAIDVVYVTDLRQFEVPFVADLSGSLGLQPYQSIMGELQSLEDQKATIILDQGEQSLRNAGFEGEITRVHRTGFLVDCLAELERQAAIVVIGKRGENANFATEHLGSTMERVVRASSRPCLVASRSFKDIKRILVPFQNVESCQAAIEFIGKESLFKDLEVHLVSVAPTDDEASVLEDLHKAEETLKGLGVSPIVQMLHGIVPVAIATYAREASIDMLAMGAYGHSRIRHLIIGSTTTETLRTSLLPTLLFR